MTGNAGAPEAPLRIGILGGGQLGAFLCRAARALDVHSTVIDPAADCSAAAVADVFYAGDWNDSALIDRLADEVDYITFEIEAIAPEILTRLADHAKAGRVIVAPDPEVLRLLQNKGLQKQWLVRQGLPTALFLALEAEELDAGAIAGKLGLPFVQKAQTGGYDGRGVQVIHSEAEFPSLWPVPTVAEPYLAERRELAVLVARSQDGQLACYDPVSLEFYSAGNILDQVMAPATVSSVIAERAMGIARAAIKGLGTPGLFAVEMFLLPDDSLLINEISPRVHNAGHHTMEACETSQFEQHVRAVLGMALGSTQLKRPAVMKNLLAEPGRHIDMKESEIGQPRSLELESGLHVHWYGKAPSKAWRKIGHITSLDADPAVARDRACTALNSLAEMGPAA
ncbi:MAG: 5-(carboxyamino)imidazole ribonucleotide synthase [Pseudomonadota bacterium]